ncbi:MAG: gliding motility-associated ABC transporter permease subunit GldF [Psychroflexus sp.]|uniref:gliding motility-associated ABC transporter permease subunit GldF n=1 Tax=Psychroflexus sp. S27 TaxID=1982757 RepID=UPI000C2A3494|nr:gliding motility-associated ABC transporter permease subunit GldF [Psychroflexus sp. S27]PJX24442.1 gliding motility-associated ABC transporter permease subunit GldF [Psychroflexus sp. S27]
MFAILKKEFNSFFSSTIGYLIISIFLIATGLFIWVFDSNFNLFNYGYANLTPFFELMPWIFIFLIPAICMKSFSDEIKQGTIELLFTKPISTRAMIYGKFLGAFSLSTIAVIPTVIYIFSIDALKQATSIIDYSAIATSYLGLLLMIGAFVSISLFSSVLSKNQISAFIIGVFICLIMFFAFAGLSTYQIFASEIYGIEYLSLSYHYKAMSRGVIDTRNIIYLVSISILFLELTKVKLEKLRQ